MTAPDQDQLTIPPDGRPLSEQPRWRQDFPIDWPQDHFVARRDFTKFMVLTSLAFAAGQLWIVVENLLRKRRGQPAMRQIAKLDEIPVGGYLTFDYPEQHDGCVLIRPSERALVAFSQSCTHLSCSVIPRLSEGQFHCPCHEGYFDLLTGRPLAGPPGRPLTKIKLELRQGTIYAAGIEERTV